MNILSALDLLEHEQIFTEWKKSNLTSYLCHCLKITDDTDAWHIGYYNSDDTITSFIVSASGITEPKTEQIFKKETKAVLALDMEKVMITDTQARNLALETLKTEYPKELAMKEIMVLQNLNGKALYNITVVTMAMNTVNVRIDAQTGEKVSTQISSLMQLGTFLPKEEKEEEEKSSKLKP